MRGVVMFLIFSVLLLSGLTGYQLVQARDTHSALCAFKVDLRGRYINGGKILADHPEDPVKVFGLTIPRDQLMQTHKSQKSTLDSLAVLDCT